ncbi:MAG: hypothetical protein ACREMP_06175 [Candidatus Tyrphobacter sp.]
MRRLAGLALVVCAAIFALGAATAQRIAVTGQILAYQDGYVFFTVGDGFHVSSSITIENANPQSRARIAPAPRVFARAVFDGSGTIVELDLSRTPLPPEGSFDQVRRFAVALSSPVPNPDLVQHAQPGVALGTRAIEGSGRPVLVIFEVQVPPQTPFDAQVYMTTDASAWNPQAMLMQRVGSMHFRVVERLNVGTILHYLYDRGSFASVERGEGGLDEKPRTAIVRNVDQQVYDAIVYRWADEGAQGQLMQPNVFPTPYNPAPFPNLPPGIHTPRP